MRLISQNGLFDYPYNSECFVKSAKNDDGSYKVIISRSMNSRSGIIFATYSTEVKAERAIAMILRAKSRGRQFYKFPADDSIDSEIGLLCGSYGLMQEA